MVIVVVTDGSPRGRGPLEEPKAGQELGQSAVVVSAPPYDVAEGHEGLTAAPVLEAQPPLDATPISDVEPTEAPTSGPAAPTAVPEEEESFPDAESTGPPAGVPLTASDSLTITVDGTTVDLAHVHGTITVKADDVTIRRTLVDSHGRYPIQLAPGHRRLLVEDTEIDGNGVASVAILSAHYTLRRVDIHDVRDGPRIEGPSVLIEESYIHHLTRVPGGHHDAIQIRQGSGIVIRGNSLQAYNPETDELMNAAIQVGSLVGPLDGMLVEGNLMNGGNYTVNPGGDSIVSTYRDNVFQRDHRYGAVGGPGARTVWEDSNVWADTGRPVRSE